MAATGARQQQQQPAAAAADPKFELAEKAGSYVLRITLTGLRKDDFRVQVDRAGRLTVRGAGATRPGPGSSLHKVFQLPADASLDDIAGRFQAGVLTLTVPKRAGTAAPPTSVEEIKKTTPGMAREEDAKTTQPAEVDAAKTMPAKPGPAAEVDGAKKMAKEEGAAKPTPPAKVDGAKKMAKEEGAAKPPPPAQVDGAKKMSEGGGAGNKETGGAKQPATREDGGEKKETAVGTEPKESTLGRTTRQVAEHVKRMEEDSRRKEIEHKPAPAAKKEQEPKPMAPQAAAATPEKPAPEPNSGEVDKESLAEATRRRGEEEKAKAAAAETTRRRGEEERAKAAAAATAIEAKAERAKKAVASTCSAWKARIAGELKGLADMKWADDAVEVARRNKELVAVGVAAFSIGFLVSQKLCRK